MDGGALRREGEWQVEKQVQAESGGTDISAFGGLGWRYPGG